MSVRVKKTRYTSSFDAQGRMRPDPCSARKTLFALRFFGAGFLHGLHDGLPWTLPGFLQWYEATVG